MLSDALSLRTVLSEALSLCTVLNDSLSLLLCDACSLSLVEVDLLVEVDSLVLSLVNSLGRVESMEPLPLSIVKL